MRKDKSKAKHSDELSSRKQADNRLKETEERFRVIFDNASDGILLVDPETKRFYLGNKTICQKLMYSEEEIKNLGIQDIHTEEALPYVIEQFKKLTRRESELAKDIPIKRKDGSIFYADINSFPVTIAGKHYMTGIFRDITERKRGEEELSRYRMRLEEMVLERTAEMENANKETRLYQERMEALINSSKDFISLKDTDFKYMIANKAYEKIFNIEVSYIIGKTDFDCMPRELARVTRKTDEEALRSEDPVESEASIGDRVFHVVTQRCFDEKEAIIGVVAIMRDITAHKHTERELTEAKERFQTLSSSLLRMMEEQRRHIARELHDEIGQQLTVLRIKLQNAQQLSNSKEYLNSLNDTTAIVENLVQVVRNLSLELRPSILDDLGLVPALRFCVSRLKQETGKLIDFVADSVSHRFPPEIENACFRVAQETLTNAIKHSKAQKIVIELRQTENNLQLTIFDDGIGFDVQAAMEEAKMGRSFGLLGIHERIFLIGGTIKIESAPGKGTKIQAYFPLTEES